MAELPTGTVTFLFTDIEGSTRLLYASVTRTDPTRRLVPEGCSLSIEQAVAEALEP